MSGRTQTRPHAINHILKLLFDGVGQHRRAFFDMDLRGAHEFTPFSRGSLSKNARCRIDEGCGGLSQR
jgi:hypothetical protein